MELTENTHDGVSELAVQGNVDTASSGPLEQRLLAIIDSGVRALLLECSAMEYINSSGLKVVLIAAKKLDALGGKLVLSGLSHNVYMIFEMIGFTQILNIAPTREEALRLCAPDGAAA